MSLKETRESLKETSRSFPYVFVHRERDRHGKRCRKLGTVRPAQMWIHIEFEDGKTAVVPASAIRRKEG